MRKIYLMLIGVMLIGTTAMSQCTELYISEYIEGSSSNKAVELYNPTDQPINLSDYAVLLFGNGATSPNQSLLPTGTIAPYDVFVIANSSADA
ncbi:MAG: putative extracellular nuclease, partial [Bacteroidia bacterium]